MLANKMSITFKNFVLRRIDDIRIKKSKPGLKELIMNSLKQKNKKDQKIRDYLKKKVLEIYEN